MSRKHCKRKHYIHPIIANARGNNLRSAMRDYRIWFHILGDGDAVEDGLTSIYGMARVLEDALPSGDEQSQIALAVAVINECHQRGTWFVADLPLINDTINIILSRYPALNPDVAKKSVAKVMASL